MGIAVLYLPPVFVLEEVTVLTLAVEDPFESVVVALLVEVTTDTMGDVEDGAIVEVDELVVLEPALSVVG